jgi:tetratricopeptide (TPR) repeat protein
VCFTNVEANAMWEVTEDTPVLKRLTVRERPPLVTSASPGAGKSDRQRLQEFWTHQRAAMDAMKVEKDILKAIGHFRAALVLNPDHEDSRYYLGNCLAMRGDSEGALEQLKHLTRINPQSHRGHSQWGALRAMSAASDADLQSAEESLLAAYRLNPEETGVLLLLGEVALLRGNAAVAKEHLEHACRTNPKAVGGFFLRGYLAWKANEPAAARELLAVARQALGQDWQPKGSTSEGDVRQRWHAEKSPLSRFWEAWDGAAEPESTFASLDAHLRSIRQMASR